MKLKRYLFLLLGSILLDAYWFDHSGYKRSVLRSSDYFDIMPKPFVALGFSDFILCLAIDDVCVLNFDIERLNVTQSSIRSKKYVRHIQNSWVGSMTRVVNIMVVGS